MNHHSKGVECAFQRFFKPITFPVAADNMGLVRDTVQKRGCQRGIAEYLGPIAKSQIGGNNHRPSFVPLGQHLEQQFGGLFGKRDVTQLISVNYNSGLTTIKIPEIQN